MLTQDVTEVLRVPLQNAGVLLTNVPTNIVNDIDLQLELILKHRKLAGKLASFTHPVGGQISEQINFVPKKSFEEFLFSFVNTYIEKYYQSHKTANKHIAWLNLQKKYEYNPNHNHNGDISYVMWKKIPYFCEDEDKVENTINSSVKANGRFSFSYVNVNNEISFKLLNVDKTYENKIMLFPSSLVHCVYPFYTSDEYRISISGNVWLNA